MQKRICGNEQRLVQRPQRPPIWPAVARLSCRQQGLSRTLPCGKGLFAVRGLADGARAIRSIVTDYSLHSQAARKIALEHLDAKIVLGRFLGELGI